MGINEQLHLGVKSIYPKEYNPDVLFPIRRDLKRQEINIDRYAELPFSGVDIWNAYEISWLDQNGKPVVAIGKFVFPCNSSHIVESKSLKLYLNSFNQTKFENAEAVSTTIQEDLSRIVEMQIVTELYLISEAHMNRWELEPMEGDCIDKEEVQVADYQPNPKLLKIGEKYTRNTLYSNLLKSNCLVTNQPDWGSIQISYVGKEIDKSSLLKYIISYREHCEFHEQCVERIFMDIMLHCKPDSLSVFAKYTRRGGLDINPFRTTDLPLPVLTRDLRQ